ncbi:MAG: HAD family phosphatase [Candidatus Omnitrophica bacterium]|nr:HAD family phosphatase [Candidatus Omnitrophota bacterium]
MTIKAILFDLGNVLVFFDPRRSSSAFAKAVGIPEDEIWKLFFTSELENEYTRGKISSEEFYQKVSEHFPKKLDFRTFARLWNDIFTENTEMIDLIKRLKKNYPLYLISNTNDLHFEFVRSRFPIMRHFTKYFPSHLVGRRKPDRAIFQHVLEEIKLAPEETVFIDDISEFVESAKSLGIHGIQFISRKELERKLARLGIKF